MKKRGIEIVGYQADITDSDGRTRTHRVRPWQLVRGPGRVLRAIVESSGITRVGDKLEVVRVIHKDNRQA